MNLDLFNKDGQVTGSVDLPDSIFGIEPNEHAMYQTVVAYLASQRQGTHKTKTRAEVSGGGKKPWRQKGRGTARSGSSRSPVWVGGGTVHGPFPHRHDIKITKKLKGLARRSALSQRLLEKNLIVIEDFKFEEIKTKQMADILKNLDLQNEKTLILLPANDHITYLSTRNLHNVEIMPAAQISTYDILNHKKLLLFKGAIEVIENIFKN